MTLRAAWATAAAAVLSLAPRLADACPACANQSGGVMRGILIGSMIAAPFVAVGVGVPLVLRIARREDAVAAEPPDGDGSDGGNQSARQEKE